MSAILFLIDCPDRKGLVASTSSFFYERGFNILHCQQYADPRDRHFYMRMKLSLEDLSGTRRELEEEFSRFAEPLEMRWSVRYTDRMERLGILVTKESHCLYDLLLRKEEGELRCEIPVIISNHPTLEGVADRFRIPFHCLPVTPETRQEQEGRLLDLLRRYHIDVVVLARYMQILTPRVVDPYRERLINIHHAFLPAFQGGNPYERAYDRGVKMIGATAHYVTEELDEGPIIEQDVERVNHEHTPDELRRIGRDIERIVLARAVKAHVEHQLIVSGGRTISFSGGAS
jgi:formyltetrahydrofolate deformylase